MSSIEAVVDLDSLRAEIKRLNEEAAAPDLWDDQAGAAGDQPDVVHPGRAGAGRGAAPPARRRRVMFELAEARTTRTPSPRRGRTGRACGDDQRARGPHPALRRVRRPRGAGHHQRRGGRRRRRRLRRDAAAHVPALGRAAQLPDRGLRHLLRGGGRHQVGHLRGQVPVRVRHAARRARVRTGWCASARSTTRAAGRPRSPASTSCRSSSRPTTSRSPRTSSGSTSTAPPAPAARASTPPTPPYASPTCPPASSSPARTSARRSRTGPRR